MKIEGPLINAIFIERPNRFITIIEIGGKKHNSHLPDPGRLKELLIPGVSLLVRPAPENKKRSTAFTTIMVNLRGQWISLVSTLPNQFVKYSFQNKCIPIFQRYKLVKPEVAIRNHRFDFLLHNKSGKNFFLEVKSVTFVEDGIAKFPDAVTTRGRNHAKTLTDLVKEGEFAGILFVCQRPDATLFEPMWDRDPMFSNVLFNAYKMGVKVWCITLNISQTEISFNKEIPVNFKNK
ncbi:MAG: DNA/RNA nuclease SfsA [Candidatus Neomarinimicrobiota bacterium]